jgi:hypothetical protein
MEAVVSRLASASQGPLPFWNTKVTRISKHDEAWVLDGHVKNLPDVTLGEFDAVVLSDQALVRQGSAGHAAIQATGKVLK